jgi:hypothetical protein
MKKIYLILFCFTTLQACANNGNGNYEQSKKRSSLNITSTQKQHFIIDSLAKYWLGTTWDFNGTTEQPRQGSIACGYFVTTLLRDAGYSVQRIKWAQAPSSVLIKNTCKQIKTYTALANVENYLAALPDKTLCIVGLDFHTGFAYRVQGKCYFLHASWCAPTRVVVEEFSKCKAIQKNAAYYVGAVK